MEPIENLNTPDVARWNESYSPLTHGDRELMIDKAIEDRVSKDMKSLSHAWKYLLTGDEIEFLELHPSPSEESELCGSPPNKTVKTARTIGEPFVNLPEDFVAFMKSPTRDLRKRNGTAVMAVQSTMMKPATITGPAEPYGVNQENQESELVFNADCVEENGLMIVEDQDENQASKAVVNTDREKPDEDGHVMMQDQDEDREREVVFNQSKEGDDQISAQDKCVDQTGEKEQMKSRDNEEREVDVLQHSDENGQPTSESLAIFDRLKLMADERNTNVTTMSVVYGQIWRVA